MYLEDYDEIVELTYKAFMRNIPFELIKSYVIPFIVPKPTLVCKWCDKVLHMKKDVKNKKPGGWVIKFKNSDLIIGCCECYNTKYPMSSERLDRRFGPIVLILLFILGGSGGCPRPSGDVVLFDAC